MLQYPNSFVPNIVQTISLRWSKLNIQKSTSQSKQANQAKPIQSTTESTANDPNDNKLDFPNTIRFLASLFLQTAYRRNFRLRFVWLEPEMNFRSCRHSMDLRHAIETNVQYLYSSSSKRKCDVNNGKNSKTQQTQRQPTRTAMSNGDTSKSLRSDNSAPFSIKYLTIPKSPH